MTPHPHFQLSNILILIALLVGLIGLPQNTHAQEADGPIAFGVEWSRNWIAVPSNDGVWIYDTNNLESPPTHYFAGSVISTIAFDPIRDRLAVYDATVLQLYMIDPATGEVIAETDGQISSYSAAYQITYSSDGKLLALVFSEAVLIHDGITYAERAVANIHDVPMMAAGSEPGTFLFGSSWGDISTMDVDGITTTFSTDDLTRNETISTLWMLPNSSEGIALRGTGLIQFNLDDETSTLLNSAFEERVRGFEMNHAADTLAISQDGLLSFYDLASATIIKQITAEGQIIFDLAFGPDDSQLVTLETTGTIQISDVAEGKVTDTLHNNFVSAYRPSGG